MSSNGNPGSPRILLVRLSAMGDVIHALPAAATLKNSFPGCRLTWVIEPKWAVLLEGNPHVDRIVHLDRSSLHGIAACWREVRRETYDFAIDLQGLIKSSLVVAAARAGAAFGFDPSQLREKAAGFFYSKQVKTRAAHVVDQNLEVAAAAGALLPLRVFPLPEGRPEGKLPRGEFVLASPLAGWGSKQWPMEHYRTLAGALARDLGVPLVLNLAPGAETPECPGALVHRSSIAGLIDATRRATAVVGVDSGPLHIAAALGKPGVAIFGPTDPARNGPYGDSLRVLRSEAAATTYRRGAEIDASMRSISPERVMDILKAVPRRCPV
jgi:heptosyltransferase-1